MQGLESNPRSLLPRTRTTRHQFAFGGVAFEVLADKSVLWEVPESYQRHMLDTSQTTVIGDVVCSVRVDRGLSEQVNIGHELSLHEAGAQTRVIAAQLCAQISEIRPGKYAATARVTPGRSGAGAVLLGVASAVLQRLGGLHLHAAGVELEGEAVLYLGPKRGDADAWTAAALTIGPHQPFAYGRVCIAPGPDERMWAFSLPGDDALAGAMLSSRQALPLAGLVRVRRDPAAHGPALELLTGARRALALREAVAIADDDAATEARRMQRVSELSARIPLLELKSALDAPIDALVRAGLHAAKAVEPQAK